MLVRFWGVRGSTPTPTSGNLKYGGNTPCLEVRTTGGQLIILDAGSGIRALGRQLLQETPPDGHRIMLFLTHYHWDHIQGFPFFEPMYAPQNHVYVHGFDTQWGPVERALGEQMANPFFPVGMSVMRAGRDFYTIAEETLQIGDAKVTTLSLNHPQGCLGYRIEDERGILVYATDNEHGDPKGDANIRRLAEYADVLIYDAQYTPEEYEKSKVGWGHSTWEQGVRIAKEVGAKELILFHHDPDHSDYFIDTMVRDARQQFPNVHAAREGMEIDLARFTTEPAYQSGFDKRYNTRHQVPLPLAVRMHDVETDEEYTLVENISLDGAYFLANSPIEAGKEIELEIALSPNGGGSGKIKAVGRVVRCEPMGEKVGVGVTFR
jgi:phosphoribosyl 1,2-cyclic phosphodiesterase